MVVEHTAAFAADTGIGKPMQRKLHEMLRLALAVRDADGDDPAPTSLRRSGVAPPAPRRPVSEHVIAPGQERLFELRRDRSPVVELARQDLPTLTESAVRLLADLDSVMKQEMWSTVPADKTRNTLTVLVAWLGADAPLLESDIRVLVDNRSLKFSGRRVTQFLEARGLLIPAAEFAGTRTRSAWRPSLPRCP